VTDESPLLMVPIQTCDVCHRPAPLLARIRFERLCVRCWRALPEDRRWPPPCTMQEGHLAEVAARDAMQRRGGTDRHLVRKGLS
jgi:hypothetical protein